jgi:hypothetical protein
MEGGWGNLLKDAHLVVKDRRKEYKNTNRDRIKACFILQPSLTVTNTIQTPTLTCWTSQFLHVTIFVQSPFIAQFVQTSIQAVL